MQLQSALTCPTCPSGKRTLAQFIDVALHEVVMIMGPKPSAIQAMINWLKRWLPSTFVMH
jgi:hypothetical protein